MKLLTARLGTWHDVDAGDDAAVALQEIFAQILLSTRLVVLAGLGTSRCITDVDGDLIAPTRGDLWKCAQTATGAAFEATLDKIRWSDRWEEDVELLLARCQMGLALDPDDQLREFIEVVEGTVVSECRFVSPNMSLPVHEAFLRKVARRSTNLPRVQIFTTNYDLAFEVAASRTSFSIVDGFSHSDPQRFDRVYFERDFATREAEDATAPTEWASNVFQLHKLHGSVDWIQDGEEVRRADGNTHPPVIYPRAGMFGLSYDHPLLDLMGRFQAALRRSETGVLVIGSGLRDDHITRPLMKAIRASASLNCLIIAPGLAADDNAIIGTFMKLIAGGDDRLALLDGTFETAVQGLPHVIAPTEAERRGVRLGIGLGDEDTLSD